MTAAPVPTEREVQRHILAMAKLCFPRVICHHSANAHGKRGKRGMVQAAMNKADGVQAGWPDLIFIAPDFIAFGEVKRPKGSVTSDNQTAMLDRLSSFGFPTSILKSAEQAYRWLREIGAPWSGIKFVDDDEREAA